ncbi:MULTISPECIES: hypothetical protein [Solibacillus]|uniref:Tetratricopeptide repeat protein n=1 Tax=Solibacillus merdavium TaxID=2762218 RepID=A0ABR8XT23_9BACL|nr:hypothetical protein [Solibacillus merdavium]MBD8035072.1 hypothetical protein [Solibacillus merdavium]
MTMLPSYIKEKIENFVDKSNEQFNNGCHQDSILLLEEAWNLIPEPKGIYSEESYHIVKDIIETYYVLNDFKKAKEWGEKIYLTGFARIDSGEKEYINGEIAFELGNLEIAKEFFSIANDKSEGRCFDSPNRVKYLKFFKSN